MEHLDPQSRCFFTQQLFLLGTYNADKSANFAPISWISYTHGQPSCLVISIAGIKQTKENIKRSGLLSATIVTPDLLSFVERFNAATNLTFPKNIPAIQIEQGTVVDAPLIAGAAFCYECQVLHTVTIGDCDTFFAQIMSINVSKVVKELEYLDLRLINPVVYSPMHYFSIGNHLGKIGDFSRD